MEPANDLPLDSRVAHHICQARAYVLRRDDAAAKLALLETAAFLRRTCATTPRRGIACNT